MSTNTAATVAQTIEAGAAHHRAGRLAQAEAAYRRVLASNPRHADALHLLGLIAMQTQSYAQSLELIAQAIEIAPNPTYYDNLGCMFRQWGKLAAAAECHRQAIALQPAYHRAHDNLGQTLLAQRQTVEAVQCFRAALAVNPSFADAHSNLANALCELRDYDGAMHHAQAALALDPSHAEAHNNLGNAFKYLQRLDAAAQHYQRALELKPQVAEIHANLGKVLLDQGRFGEAIERFTQALTLRPGWAEAHSGLLFCLSALPGASPANYLAHARAFGRDTAARAQRYTSWPTSHAGTENVLRIGLVSGDLRSHPVGYFVESVIAHLDPARFELIAYATRPDEDALTARIKPRFAAWRDISTLDDAAAARTIHNDGIHILVDLAEHTNYNRLPVFAWKPAPVQISWLGYFASTGLAEIDYVLGDRHVLPDDEASHFVERPWCLPDNYLCFTPPDDDLPVAALPASSNGYITFGCFSDLMKVNDEVVAVWSRVLRALPTARLLLKARQLGDPATHVATRARFAAHGIEGERMMLEGPSSRAAYLAAHARIDIGLSPFPYPGGTTTAESAWMGVPVLCRRGDRFLSHLGESVLHAAGLADWIAEDNDDYVAQAVARASDLPQLVALRAGLRAKLLQSPLCDAPRFVGQLEAAFIDMWRSRTA